MFSRGAEKDRWPELGQLRRWLLLQQSLKDFWSKACAASQFKKEEWKSPRSLVFGSKADT